MLRRSVNSQRGFTLIEMMVVVIIMGILATLAVYGVRKYVFSSKTTEAIHMIGSIKSAEEAYRAETFTYAGLAKTGLSSDANLYPQGGLPGRLKYDWNKNTGDTYTQAIGPLGVVSDSPVVFGYVVAAGTGALPSSAENGTGCEAINWGPRGQNNTGPWYVVKALGNQNGDTTYSCFISSSLTGEILSKNDDE